MRVLPRINFNLPPEEILNLTRLVLGRCVEGLDRVGTTALSNCTFDNVIWPMAHLETVVRTELSAANFLQYVSTDAAVREASVEATKLIDVCRCDSLAHRAWRVAIPN